MGITVVGAASVYLAPKKKDGDDDGGGGGESVLALLTGFNIFLTWGIVFFNVSDTAARDPMVGNLLIIIAQVRLIGFFFFAFLN